jgi:hypothetical protein
MTSSSQYDSEVLSRRERLSILGWSAALSVFCWLTYGLLAQTILLGSNPDRSAASDLFSVAVIGALASFVLCLGIASVRGFLAAMLIAAVISILFWSAVFEIFGVYRDYRRACMSVMALTAFLITTILWWKLGPRASEISSSK